MTPPIFHLLNPAPHHRRGVLRFFGKRPDLSRVLIERATHPTHLETVVEWAIDQGHKRIAVWGGDGTLNRVVNALHAFDALRAVTVALVPAGTANDFARKIGLPSWRSVAQGLTKGVLEPRPFDLVRMELNGGVRLFVNNAGFGRRPDALHQKRNAVRDLLALKEHHVDVEWGGGKVHLFETWRAVLVMICNGPYFSGGMHFARDVEPDDGRLDVFLVPPRSKAALFARLLRGKAGRPLGDRRLPRFAPAFINITTKEPFFPQADGEVLSAEGVTAMRCAVLPRALHVEMPV